MDYIGCPFKVNETAPGGPSNATTDQPAVGASLRDVNLVDDPFFDFANLDPNFDLSMVNTDTQDNSLFSNQPQVQEPVPPNGLPLPGKHGTLSLTGEAIPDVSKGPYYHPDIGWYFPCAAKEPAARKKCEQRPPVQPRARTGRGKELTIVQACVCIGRQEHIKRPRNAFIIYRNQRGPAIRRKGQLNPQVSKTVAQSWKCESEETTAKFYEMARKEKEAHRERHPEYKYSPGEASRKQFGSKGCTCGAYRANLANLVAEGLDRPTSDSEQDHPVVESGAGHLGPRQGFPGLDFPPQSLTPPGHFVNMGSPDWDEILRQLNP